MLLNPDGFRPDQEKIALILEYLFEKLETAETLLGMSGWYRKFSKNFDTVADPMTHLR